MPATRTAARSAGELASVLPARRRFTVGEYYRMAEAGILGPEERVELLDGEILVMSPIGNWHAICVAFLTQWFADRLKGRALVWAQNPIRLDDGSEPEPDLALIVPPLQRYVTQHPGPRDALLVIEVADTSLEYDLGRKLPRYARAGIPEVWIVDLSAEQLRVHREPHGFAYRHSETVGRDGTVSSAAFPDLLLPLTDLFAVLKP